MTWTLLDGGTGQELLRRSQRTPTPLWSAQILIDEPTLVRDVHRGFIDAGADVITVSSYSATPCRLAPYGRADEAPDLQRRAVELATEARNGDPNVRIAGCLSPFRWSYRPELAPPYDELLAHYRRIAEWQAAGVDLFLCETMGSVREAVAAATAAGELGQPVWASYTIADTPDAAASDTADTTEPGTDAPAGAGAPSVGPVVRDGTPLDEAVAALPDEVEAVLVNCSTAEAVTAAVDTLAASGRRFGAYANGFDPMSTALSLDTASDPLGQRSDLDPETFADIALGWVAAGATIIGGCCHISPEHIAAIHRRRV